MDLSDISTRLSRIQSMHYSANGEVVGMQIEMKNGTVLPLTISAPDLRRLVEMLLSISKEAGNAPRAVAPTPGKWMGEPLDVDRVSILDLTNRTHAVLALTFGITTVAIRAPHLLWEELITRLSPTLAANDSKPN